MSTEHGERDTAGIRGEFVARFERPTESRLEAPLFRAPDTLMRSAERSRRTRRLAFAAVAAVVGASFAVLAEVSSAPSAPVHHARHGAKPTPAMGGERR